MARNLYRTEQNTMQFNESHQVRELCYCRVTARRACQYINLATTKHPIVCAVVCVILRLAVLTQYRSVTDTQTHDATYTSLA